MNSKYKSIIVVDGDTENLVVAKNSLDKLYNVYTVPSAKTLFLLLENMKPDLILLDSEMSEMSDYEIIAILRKSEDTAYIPIIFLSSKADPEGEKKGFSLGIADYLAKPFSGKLLLRRVALIFLAEAQKNEL